MSGLIKRKLKVISILALMVIFLLICGCATQSFKSVHSSDVVASCIKNGWEHSAWSGLKVPVIIEKQNNGYFVGVALGSDFYTLPSGLKHPSYPVWAEVTDTDSGSVTEYHRAYQIFHGRLDKAVCGCQEPNQ